MIVGRARFAVGRNLFHGHAVVVDLQRAAAGLLIVEQFEFRRVRIQIDRFVRAGRGQADAAQTVDAVARAAHQAIGVPAARRSRAHIHPAIAVPGTPGQRESAAAIAEFFLEARAQVAGPFVGGSVRIAVVQDVQRTRHLAALMTIELLEERNQRRGILDRNIRAFGHVLVNVIMSRRSGFRGHRTAFGGSDHLFRNGFCLADVLGFLAALETYFFFAGRLLGGAFLARSFAGCTATATRRGESPWRSPELNKALHFVVLPPDFAPCSLIVAAYIRYSHRAGPRTTAPPRSWPRPAWDGCSPTPTSRGSAAYQRAMVPSPPMAWNVLKNATPVSSATLRLDLHQPGHAPRWSRSPPDRCARRDPWDSSAGSTYPAAPPAPVSRPLSSRPPRWNRRISESRFRWCRTPAPPGRA